MDRFSVASVSAKTAFRMGILHPTSDAPFTQLIIAIVQMERKQIRGRCVAVELGRRLAPLE